MSDSSRDDSASLKTEQADLDALNEEKVNKIINQAISARMKSFEKKLEDFSSKLVKSEPEPEKLSEIAQLKKQLEYLQKDRDSEKAKNKEIRLNSTLKEELQKYGVSTPAMQKAAIALLKSEGKISFDQDESLVFKSEFEDKDLSTGLKEWFTSEDGKVFLPPKGITGSGNGKFNKSEPKKSDKENISFEEACALMDEL